jgi:hypothetical protein
MVLHAGLPNEVTVMIDRPDDTGQRGLHDCKCIEPNYGSQSVWRRVKANVPNGRAGWVLTRCPYCCARCWKLDIEPDPLPPGLTLACTGCVFLRMQHNRTRSANHVNDG